MPADLIVYALIAAGLVFWLRSVLGTRHGDERERPNPYAVQKTPADHAREESYLPEDRPPSPQEMIAALTASGKGIMAVGGEAAESGLIDIANADKSFDLKHFMEGAQDAFAIIVEGFAEGDRETLKGLLDKPVYDAFEAAITEREAKGQKHETEIRAIKKAEVQEAKVQGKMAFVTIKFTAEETSVVRDKDGEILSGHPEKITQMQDIWVFGREIRSRDPRWFLFETRGEVEGGDNETLPNTH